MSSSDRPQRQPAGFSLSGNAPGSVRDRLRWRRSALSRSAGTTTPAGTLEQLEPRQLLFAVTIDGPVPGVYVPGPVVVPGPGVVPVPNTASAQFGYIIPTAVGLSPGPAQPGETITETFNDQDPLIFGAPDRGNGEVPLFPAAGDPLRISTFSAQLAGSNIFFQQTGYTIATRFTSPNDNLGPKELPAFVRVDDNNNEIRTRIAQGQQFDVVFTQPLLNVSFQTILRDGLTAANVRVPSPSAPALNPALSVAGAGLWSDVGFGLNTGEGGYGINTAANGTAVVLLQNDIEVARYVPNATINLLGPQPGVFSLEARGTFVVPDPTDPATTTPFSISYNLTGQGRTFNRIRFERIGTPENTGQRNNLVDDIILDNFNGTLPPGRWAEFMSERVRGAQAEIAGRIQPFFSNPRVPGVATDGGPLSKVTPTLIQNFEGLAAGAVASGTLFTGSNIRLTHNIGASAEIIQPGGLNAGALSLDIGDTGTDTNAAAAALTFTTAGGKLRPVIEAVISLPRIGPGSLPVAGTTNLQIELVREGTVVSRINLDRVDPNSLAFSDDNPAQLRLIRENIFANEAFFQIRSRTVLNPLTPGAAPQVVGENAFDTIRFVKTALSAGAPARPATELIISDVSAYSPTMVEFFDLYGRPLQRRLDLGVPDQATLANVDQDDDGIPDFNDGLGRVVISNSTSETNFTMIGGAVLNEGGIGFSFEPAGPAGNFEDLTTTGFGYYIDTSQNSGANAQPPTRGLPPVGGSLILGSPFFRDRADLQTYWGDNPSLITLYARARPQNDPQGTANFIAAGTDPDATSPVLAQISSSVLNFSNQPIENNGGSTPPSPVEGLPGPDTFRYQGVYVGDGESIGAVSIQGVVHGRSYFGGAVQRLSVGYMVGSVTVEGDAGQVSMGSDVGMFFVVNPNAQPPNDGPNTVANPQGLASNPIVRTGSQLSFGRTLGQLWVLGRNFGDVSVLGDVNNPSRPLLNYSRYSEMEKMYRVDPPAQTDPEVFFSQITLEQNRSPFTGFNQSTLGLSTPGLDPENSTVTGSGQAVVFGDGPIRNESLLSSEWIGNPTGAVTIDGELLGFGPIPDAGAEDTADAFAFLGVGGRTVTVNVVAAGDSTGSFNARIVDRNGRTIATHQSPGFSGVRLPIGQTAVQVRFTPQADDVYYLVLSAPASGLPGGSLSYQASVTGMAPSTVGMVSVGLNTPGSITINGSMGMLRAGVGYTGLSAETANPAEDVVNSVENARTVLSQRTLRVAVTRDVGALAFGSSLLVRPDDAGGTNIISIGGNLGSLRTGLAADLVGDPVAVGDVAALALTVGGRVAAIEVARALGYVEAGFNAAVAVPGAVGPVSIQTGTVTGQGSIGLFTVGTTTAGDRVSIDLAPGSTVDRFLLGTAAGAEGATVSTGFIVGSNINFNYGAGSDIRFLEFNGVVAQVGQTTPILDTARLLTFNQALIVTDDSGARVSIAITGGINSRASTGRVILLPIPGSSGAVIGRIEANLVGGANLTITSLDAGGRTSIGRIVATQTASTRRSNILIGGVGEVDVLRVDADGSAFDQIRNDSPNGDLVAVDTIGVNRIHTAGNLGRTETSAGAPTLIGPFLGIAEGVGGGVGTPLAAQVDVIGTQGRNLNYDFSPENLYAPLRVGGVPTISADDWGLPFDPFLNGAIIRTGNVLSVSSNKSVGDVLLSAAGVRIDSVTAAADGVVPTGEFEGIVGSIVAADIGTVDIGSGLRADPFQPLADAGIFSFNGIQQINGGRITGAVLSGPVVASNLGVTPVGRQPGVGSVVMTNGRIENAFIGSTTWDSYWLSSRFFFGFRDTANPAEPATDSPVATGPVVGISTNGTPMFRSVVMGRTIGTINLGTAAFDASRIEARGLSNVTGSGTIASVSAGEFRNSTVGGEPLEFRQSLIVASGNITGISTTGDMTDLFVNSSSEIAGITARNVTRLTLESTLRLGSLSATGSIRSSQVTASIIDLVNAAGDIRSSTITASNAISSVNATGAIVGGLINVTGVAGTLTSLRAGTELSADIISAGAVGTVSAGGDFTGRLQITNPTRGDLTSLTTGGSILGSLDIRRNIGTLQAGRDIGNRVTSQRPQRDLIEITGSLGTIQSGGQIYSDVRVGQTISRVQMGAVNAASNLPGDPAGVARDLVTDSIILAAGRIETVAITGDLGAAVQSMSGGIGTITITDGSLRQSGRVRNSIEVRDGDLGTLTITNGILGGNVSVPEGSINQISVSRTGTNTARWGSIGYEAGLLTTPLGITNRGEAPPRPANFAATNGVRDGVFITAGLDINTIQVTRGIYESVIQAGRRLGTVTVIGGAGVNTTIPTGDATFNARRTVMAAGDEIGFLTINGQNLIAGQAGARGVFIHAGLLSLGADNAPGGVGANADVIKSGRATNISLRGSAVETQVFAGIDPGANGVYNGGGDDAVAPGLSSIGTLVVANGPLASSNTIIGADTQPTATVPAGVTLFGSALPVAGGLAFPTGGATVGFTPITAAGTLITAGGGTARAKLTGPGSAFYDAVNRRIVLINTSATLSVLTLERPNAGVPVTLTNLQIQSTDDASLSALTITGVTLAGSSNMFIDGEVGTLTLDLLQLNPTLAESAAGLVTKTLRVGERVGTLSLGSSVGGANSTFLFRANRIERISSAVAMGNDRATRIDARNIGDITSGPSVNGIISSDLMIGNVTINGALTGRIRAGFNIGNVTVGSMASARVSAGGNIGNVTVNGNVSDSAILSGVDLGRDGTFDRFNPTTGVKDPGLQDIPNLPGFQDVIGAGNMGAVNITGRMERSDIAAGVSRGNSGFITGSDRFIGSGRSGIASVRATGGMTGSTNNSQGYGILSTGTLGSVINGTLAVTGSIGNLRVQTLDEQPRTLRVNSLVVTRPTPGTYTATIVFNQPINPGANSAELLAAIQIDQYRPDGSVPLAQSRGGDRTMLALQGGLTFGNGPDNLPNTPDDIDYTVRYEPGTNTVTVTFAASVATRDLVNRNALFGRVNPTLPTQGLFRFTIAGGSSLNALRSSTGGGRLDGNGDGLASANTPDNYTEFAEVGDSGDRFTEQVARNQITQAVVADYYGATNFDMVMGAWRSEQRGLPTVNRPFTLRGVLGDHPDHSSVFPQSADVDAFTISLQAGQILRLGRIDGTATLLARSIVNMAGAVEFASQLERPASNSGIVNPRVVVTPATNNFQQITSTDPFDPTESLLVLRSGTYVIVLSGDAGGFNSGPESLSNSFTTGEADAIGTVTPTPLRSNAGLLGDYRFSVEIFDDGDSGFNAPAVPADAGQITGPFRNVQVPLAADFQLVGGLPQLASLRRFDPRNPTAFGRQVWTDTNGDGTVQISEFTVVTDHDDPNYPSFRFTLRPGDDGVYNTNDDVITGTNGRGVRITRLGTNPPTVSREAVAGAMVGVQGTAPDASFIPPSVPLASAFAASTDLVTVNSTTPNFARFIFQRLPGSDGLFTTNLLFPTDDEVTLVRIDLSGDGVFGNGNDRSITDFSELGLTSVVRRTNWSSTLPPAAQGIFNVANDIVTVGYTAGGSVPLAGAFASASTVVNRDTTLRLTPLGTLGTPTNLRLAFQRLAGPDGVFGNTDDIVLPTSAILAGTDNILGNSDDVLLSDPSVLGVNITRAAGSNRPFDLAPGGLTPAGNDVIRFTAGGGDGVRLTNGVPLPNDFRGPDNVLNTADDLKSITRGEFTYVLKAATATGLPVGNGTASVRSTDRVIGTNRTGTQIILTSGTDGIFNFGVNPASDDVLGFGQAIGATGNVGVPKAPVVEPDVVHLNAGQPIAAGTRFRVTLRLAREGGNIGLLQPVVERIGSNLTVRIADSRGSVQFGIFETSQFSVPVAERPSSLPLGGTTATEDQIDRRGSNGQDLRDALVVASTNNVVGYAGNELRNGQPVRNAATGNSYGYDANGDFYFEYATPLSQVYFDRLDPTDATSPANRAGTFAVYIQGAVRSDYVVEVTRLGGYTPPANLPEFQTQNVLIDIDGGSINWLEANPYRGTNFEGFDASFNGFTGLFNGEEALRYIVDSPLNADFDGDGVADTGVTDRNGDGLILPGDDFVDYNLNGLPDDISQLNLIARLQRMFNQAAGLNPDGTPRVRFSSNPAEFLGQNFSTVYLSSSAAPPAFTSSLLSARFGESQMVDPFNANANDQAIIYTNELNLRGYQPTLSGIEQFTYTLSAAVGRRVGELLGLRLNEVPPASLQRTTPTLFGAPFIASDVMNTNSVLTTMPTNGASLLLPPNPLFAGFDFLGGVSPVNVNNADPFSPVGLVTLNLSNQSSGFARLAGQTGGTAFGLLSEFTVPPANVTTQFLFGNQASATVLNRVIFKP